MSSWQEMAEADDEISMTSMAWMAAKDLIETQKLRLSMQEDRIAALEATNAALRERLDAANDLSVAVDDWAAGEASAEHLIQTNDDFVTFCPADHGIPLPGEEVS